MIGSRFYFRAAALVAIVTVGSTFGCAATSAPGTEPEAPTSVDGKADWNPHRYTDAGAIAFGEIKTIMAVGVSGVGKPADLVNACVDQGVRSACVAQSTHCFEPFVTMTCDEDDAEPTLVAEEDGGVCCAPGVGDEFDRYYLVSEPVYYSFEGEAGDVVAIDWTSTGEDFDVSIFVDRGAPSLFNPSSWTDCPIAGAMEWFWQCPQEDAFLEDGFTLPEDGTYLVVLSDPTSWSQDYDTMYSIGLRCLSGSCVSDDADDLAAD